MQYDVQTIEAYFEAIPEDKKDVMKKLRTLVLENLPDGFSEQITYGMIGYVVPLSRYPKGYHVKKDEPLPFLAIAAQKNHIALYHLGLYGDPKIEKWFVEAYTKQVPTKLDMGKSCIRFKNVNRIPFNLIAELCRKMTVDQYIEMYERSMEKRR